MNSSSSSSSSEAPPEKEKIRDRILELLDISVLAVRGQKKPPTLMLMGVPMIKLAFQTMPLPKLILLVSCLREISTDVLNVDCSEEAYQEKMMRDLQALMEVSQ